MITGINHVTLAVSDLGRSFAFYTEVLGLKPVARWARGAYLTAGRDWICLSCVGETRPERGDGYTHIAFSVEPHTFAECSRFVRSQGVEIWQENHSEGDSLRPDSSIRPATPRPKPVMRIIPGRDETL